MAVITRQFAISWQECVVGVVVNYFILLGDKEAGPGRVAVRPRDYNAVRSTSYQAKAAG